VPPARHAVIAASRIGGGLGLGVPKCLVPVAGRPAIDYLLAALADVPHVRLIVGFRETDVMAHVRMLRPDVLFVRDPAFLRTTTLETLRLGVRGLDEPFMLLDGDAIYGRDSLARFRAACTDGKPMLGISTELGANPLFVGVRSTQAGLSVTSLSRTEPSHYAWAETAQLTPALLTSGVGSGGAPVPLFEQLASRLPMRAALLDRMRIESVDDLRQAEQSLAALTRPRQGTLIPFPKRRPPPRTRLRRAREG